MYNIAFCDDERVSLDIVCEKVSGEFYKRNLQIKGHRYERARVLQRDITEGKKFDAIFLDIAMPDFDGLNLGLWLSENCSDTYIVYVSSRNDLVYRTFKSRPFSFLRKSHLDNEVSDLVEDLSKQLKKDASIDDYFEIQLDNNEIFKFHASNIIYIDVIGKNCRVVENQGEYVTKCRLAAYKEILEPLGFIQIHKSYLVNYKYIFKIKAGEIVLDDGTVLPLSKYRAKEVKDKFIELVGKE
ncbi:MAG: response regulator transcription factor [Pseudobutyrivibrio sp.]|nr:response regulator transcription factor [Pseudobutyrivibrio sp.]